MKAQNSLWRTPDLILTDEEIALLHTATQQMLNLFQDIRVPVLFRPVGTKIPIMPGTSTVTPPGWELPCTMLYYSPNGRMYPTMVVITMDLHDNKRANLVRNYSTLVHEYHHCLNALYGATPTNSEGSTDHIHDELLVTRQEIKWFEENLPDGLARKIIEFNKKTVLGFLDHGYMAYEYMLGYNTDHLIEQKKITYSKGKK
jgi:hypothetical protein